MVYTLFPQMTGESFLLVFHLRNVVVNVCDPDFKV